MFNVIRFSVQGSKFNVKRRGFEEKSTEDSRGQGFKDSSEMNTEEKVQDCFACSSQ
jgi:hypothetical protein